LVRIAPSKPLTSRDEVEFVSVWPVTVDHDQLEDDKYGHDRTDLQHCESRSLGALHQTSFSELRAHRLIVRFARKDRALRAGRMIKDGRLLRDGRTCVSRPKTGNAGPNG
jgi:hypothetical protein